MDLPARGALQQGLHPSQEEGLGDPGKISRGRRSGGAGEARSGRGYQRALAGTASAAAGLPPGALLSGGGAGAGRPPLQSPPERCGHCCQGNPGALRWGGGEAGWGPQAGTAGGAGGGSRCLVTMGTAQLFPSPRRCQWRGARVRGYCRTAAICCGLGPNNAPLLQRSLRPGGPAHRSDPATPTSRFAPPPGAGGSRVALGLPAHVLPPPPSQTKPAPSGPVALAPRFTLRGPFDFFPLLSSSLPRPPQPSCLLDGLLVRAALPPKPP